MNFPVTNGSDDVLCLNHGFYKLHYAQSCRVVSENAILKSENITMSSSLSEATNIVVVEIPK